MSATLRRLVQRALYGAIHAGLGVVLVGALVAAIAGCGKSGDAAPGPVVDKAPAKAPAQAAAKAGNDKGASAEAVAKQARGGLSCPAKIATAARAANEPVDDVLGVRPGLSYEEALNAVLCTHELLVATPPNNRGFDLKAPEARSVRQGFAAAFAEPHVVKTSRQIMQEMQIETLARSGNAVREDLKPGQAKWFVTTMGPPGQERVLSVAREERFAADDNPTIENVLAALLKKYGPATRMPVVSATQLPIVRWAYDPQGKPVAEGSPLFNKCTGTSDPNGGVNVAPDCGLVVQALLIPQKTNPQLVDRMQVGVVNQSSGYRMIMATEAALAQTDQQRRAKEVEKSAKNTKAPAL
jgi:hypothetical protein